MNPRDISSDYLLRQDSASSSDDTDDTNLLHLMAILYPQGSSSRTAQGSPAALSSTASFSSIAYANIAAPIEPSSTSPAANGQLFSSTPSFLPSSPSTISLSEVPFASAVPKSNTPAAHAMQTDLKVNGDLPLNISRIHALDAVNSNNGLAASNHHCLPPPQEVSFGCISSIPTCHQHLPAAAELTVAAPIAAAVSAAALPILNENAVSSDFLATPDITSPMSLSFSCSSSVHPSLAASPIQAPTGDVAAAQKALVPVDPTGMPKTLHRSAQPSNSRRSSFPTTLTRIHPYMPSSSNQMIPRRSNSTSVLHNYHRTQPPPTQQQKQKPKPQQPSGISHAFVIPALNQDGSYKRCANCCTAETPSWRRHPETQQLLCNACGLYLRLHHKPRPITIDEGGHVQVIRKNAAVQREPMNLPSANRDGPAMAFGQPAPYYLPPVPPPPPPPLPHLLLPATHVVPQPNMQAIAGPLGSMPTEPPPLEISQPQLLYLLQPSPHPASQEQQQPSGSSDAGASNMFGTSSTESERSQNAAPGSDLS